MVRKFLLLLIASFFLTASCASTPQKRSFGEVIDDSMLHARLKTRFLADKTIKPGDIKIEVRRGVVKMNGVLDTQAEIDRAIEIAERTKGVLQVKAYLVLKSQQESGIVIHHETKGKNKNSDRSLNEQDLPVDTKDKSSDDILKEETLIDTLP